MCVQIRSCFYIVLYRLLSFHRASSSSSSLRSKIFSPCPADHRSRLLHQTDERKSKKKKIKSKTIEKKKATTTMKLSIVFYVSVCLVKHNSIISRLVFQYTDGDMSISLKAYVKFVCVRDCVCTCGALVVSHHITCKVHSLSHTTRDCSLTFYNRTHVSVGCFDAHFFLLLLHSCILNFDVRASE